MADRPLIGITLDYQEKGTFSQRPHYAVRTIYFAAVEAAVGVPVVEPTQAAVTMALGAVRIAGA